MAIATCAVATILAAVQVWAYVKEQKLWAAEMPDWAQMKRLNDLGAYLIVPWLVIFIGTSLMLLGDHNSYLAAYLVNLVPIVVIGGNEMSLAV